MYRTGMIVMPASHASLEFDVKKCYEVHSKVQHCYKDLNGCYCYCCLYSGYCVTQPSLRKV